METREELKSLKKRIIINQVNPAIVEYYSLTTNKVDTNEVIDALFKCELSEAPDGYFYDSDSNKLFIFEYFEFDSSRRKKGSSKLRKNLAIVNKETSDEIKKENDHNKYHEITKTIEQGYAIKENNTIVYKLGENGKEYRENYLKNFTQSFLNHQSQIGKYKKNCIEKINLDILEYVIVFVVEDVTLGGTYFLKGKGAGDLVNPLKTKQFMEVLEDSKIDYLIFNSLHDPTMLSILDKKCINDLLKNNAVDLDNKEFFVFPAMPQFTFYIKK